MIYDTDLSVINWLEIDEERICKGSGLQVSEVLPGMFSVCIALLPAVTIIEGFPFEQIDLHNSSIAQLNTNAAIWKHYGVLSAHQTPVYTPVLFRDLAMKFDLPYDAHLLKRLEWRKQGFAIEWAQTASNLSSMLRALSQNALLRLYVIDYYRWSVLDQLPSPEQVVYSVTVEEFIGFLKSTSFDATLYLFPEDRSWCLTNVEDGSFPMLGINQELKAIIALQSGIEMLLLEPETEI